MNVSHGTDVTIAAGCSKRPSSKAAASEEGRRTLRYVEPLSDARTPLADFFSILLEYGSMPPSHADRSLSGLYVILDPSACPDRSLTDVLKEAATAGARLFQYRNKSASMKEAYAEALLLRQVALDAGVTFIVNDRCDLALAVNADGVHLGQGDVRLDLARKVLGPNKLIGISTHNPDQVREAVAGNPDYLGFGPIFKPGSKQDHDPVVGLEGLRAIRRLTSLPVFAIGGIQIDQAGEVIRAGANGVAVISAVLKAPDIRFAVKSFLAQMPRSTSPA
ncbi:MAG TPA: thiamine phosphate synthase [Nitrospiraceae bacterium]|nr:thiamine phosphate synthase [Nitrospiraceae bacterium]